MARTALLSDWLAQHLDRGAAEPAYLQLNRLIRQAVLLRELRPGMRLPASRVLARELGVARNTVIEVYEQLAVEGFVEGSPGSGTFVKDTEPPLIGRTRRGPAPATRPDAAPPARALSRRGREVLERAGVFHRQWGAFMPGVPDVTRFPAQIWMRLLGHQWRGARPEQLSYAPPGGSMRLRRAIAGHLMTARGVRCVPEQVIVTSGIHQAVDLATRLLCDSGDEVWTEDPCYWGLRSVLHSQGLRTRALPVDAQGIDLRAAAGHAAPALVLVTPSHQYPLGMVMSLARRRALIDYARRSGCWVIEDDYDSEFRYDSRPLISMQAIDDSERVIYVGSLGKVLFPGLRVGYLVAPPALADAFAMASAELYREGSLLVQEALAVFIDEGHLAAHVRRMRQLYGERRRCLIEQIHRHFGDALPVHGGDAGLHLVLGLPAALDDRAIAAEALARDVATRPLSRYYAEPASAPPGLLLGYACVPEADISPRFETLAEVIAPRLAATRPARRPAPRAAAGRARAAGS